MSRSGFAQFQRTAIRPTNLILPVAKTIITNRGSRTVPMPVTIQGETLPKKKKKEEAADV
jgi:hypothetical protein